MDRPSGGGGGLTLSVAAKTAGSIVDVANKLRGAE